jgi:hypothetical protein
MKTVLKVGQKVDIYERVCGKPALEGTATLIKLVTKNHNTIPPYETWIVDFDDDGEPVQRDIRVSLPQASSMASSLARSPEGKSLLTFISGLEDGLADPKSNGVTAYVSGKVLGNEVGAKELAGNNQVNDELLVHLECRDEKVILNLNTLLILASSYIRQQYGVVTEAIENAARN